MSARPKPVTTTSRLAAPSTAGEEEAKRSDHAPVAEVRPRRMLRLSTKTVKRSASISPSESSSTFTRSRPGPGSFRGYSMLSVIQIRPRSSNAIASGFTMSGSCATISTENPSGTVMRSTASLTE